MARRKRDAKGRFVSNRKKTYTRKHSSRKRNPVAKSYSKPRRYARNAYLPNRPKKRHYKRNPSLFGRGGKILGLSIQEIAFIGIGFIAPPAIEGAISKFIPTSISSNRIGKWAVKVGIVFGASMIGGKFVGKNAGRYIAVGGATFLLANAIVEFMPTLFSGFSGMRYMSPGQNLRGMRAQPGLGAYLSSNLPVSYASGGAIPDRLDPRARF